MSYESATDKKLEDSTLKSFTIINDTEKNRETASKLLTELIKDFNAGKTVRFRVETQIDGEKVMIRNFPNASPLYNKFKFSFDNVEVYGKLSLDQDDSKYLKEDDQLLATLLLCATLSNIRHNKKDEPMILPTYQYYETLDKIDIAKIASTIKVSDEERKLFLHFFEGKITALERTKQLNVRTDKEIEKFNADKEEIEKFIEKFDVDKEYIAKIQEKFMTALGTDVKLEEIIRSKKEVVNQQLEQEKNGEPEVTSKVKSIREKFLGAIFKKKDLSA